MNISAKTTLVCCGIADGSVVWDGGEPVLENWTIYLDLDGNGLVDRAELTSAYLRTREAGPSELSIQA